MTKAEFLQLMRFPPEWEALGMYPQELFELQAGRYEPGHERGSEHDRNGAFHWWLRRGPSRREVENLRRLASVDPDRALGEDMRRYLDDPTLPPGYVVRD
jgi:hypothetical protein